MQTKKKYPDDNVAQTTVTRKRRFRAALGLAGLTAQQWAEKRGVNNAYLSRVLNGEFRHSYIVQMVEEFATQQLSGRDVRNLIGNL